jgi:hypothetical protein
MWDLRAIVFSDIIHWNRWSLLVFTRKDKQIPKQQLYIYIFILNSIIFHDGSQGFFTNTNQLKLYNVSLSESQEFYFSCRKQCEIVMVHQRFSMIINHLLATWLLLQKYNSHLSGNWHFQEMSFGGGGWRVLVFSESNVRSSIVRMYYGEDSSFSLSFTVVCFLFKNSSTGVFGLRDRVS